MWRKKRDQNMVELTLEDEEKFLSPEIKTHEEILKMIEEIKTFEENFSDLDNIEYDDIEEIELEEDDTLVEFKPIPEEEISLNAKLKKFLRTKHVDEPEVEFIPVIEDEEKEPEKKTKRILPFKLKKGVKPEEEEYKSKEIEPGATIKLRFTEDGKLELADKRKPKKPASESKFGKIGTIVKKLKFKRKSKGGETSESSGGEASKGSKLSKLKGLKGIGGKLGGIKKIGNIKEKLPLKRKGKKASAGEEAKSE